MKMKIKVHNKSGMKFKKIEKKIDRQILEQCKVFDGITDFFCQAVAILWGMFLCFLGITSLFAPINRNANDKEFLLTVFLKLLLFFMFGFGGVCVSLGRIREIFLKKSLRKTIKDGTISEKIRALQKYKESSVDCFDQCIDDVSLNDKKVSPIDAYIVLLIAKSGKVTLKWNKKNGRVSFTYKDESGKKHSYKSLEAVPYRKNGKNPVMNYYGYNLYLSMYGTNP